uniref:Uncharacterized protein n=1 Tax=Manihot esculenta TaxID=3983 RepID=A0A2C9WJF3_MANES
MGDDLLFLPGVVDSSLPLRAPRSMGSSLLTSSKERLWLVRRAHRVQKARMVHRRTFLAFPLPVLKCF